MARRTVFEDTANPRGIKQGDEVYATLPDPRGADLPRLERVHYVVLRTPELRDFSGGVRRSLGAYIRRKDRPFSEGGWYPLNALLKD
jgi:hypothetical protein